jgi:primosomal protein N' (replication factor Y)
LFCGPGVERIYAEIKKIYPNKKIEIFSSDTLSKKKFTSTLLKKVENKKIDILVGTQLLSKGFHFPKLNCIVVIDSDFSSHGYDLRAAEKNMQLYHQLSGRAGREGDSSTILFQTYSPDDEVLLNISKNDPYKFLQKELLLRKEKKLPPFYRLISLIISGKNESLIMKFATSIKLKLPKINEEVNVLGPVLAPIFKLKKKYRCRILIRYPKNLFIQKYLSQTLNKIKIIPGIKLEVDVDPINFS